VGGNITLGVRVAFRSNVDILSNNADESFGQAHGLVLSDISLRARFVCETGSPPVPHDVVQLCLPEHRLGNSYFGGRRRICIECNSDHWNRSSGDSHLGVAGCLRYDDPSHTHEANPLGTNGRGQRRGWVRLGFVFTNYAKLPNVATLQQTVKDQRCFS